MLWFGVSKSQVSVKATAIRRGFEFYECFLVIIINFIMAEVLVITSWLV